MDNLDKVLQYRRQLEQAHQQVAKAEGALEHAMKELHSECGLNTATAGNKLRESLQEKVTTLRQQMNKQLKAFEAKWGKHLDL